MDRRDEILKFIKKGDRGVEIAPWFNPLVAKRDGYNSLVLDIFDAESLRARASLDPNIPRVSIPLIEEVDVVGSATFIGDLIRARGESNSFDYVVSSHNFEHLPNPIKFLQGCGEVLRSGGVVSVAVPDRRCCFDYFRPVTRLSEWLEAFVKESEQPSCAQCFDTREMFASYRVGSGRLHSFARGVRSEDVGVDLAEVNLRGLLQDWMLRVKSGDKTYHDSHCSVFTPSSFELLVRDAGFLGLVPFEIIEIRAGHGEFYAHLRLGRSGDSLRLADYEEIRNCLLRRIQDECAETSGRFQEMLQEVGGKRREVGQYSNGGRAKRLVRRLISRVINVIGRV